MLQRIRKDLYKYARKQKAKILRSFFKTGPGEYAEGDIFIGVKVPEIRSVVRRNSDIIPEAIIELMTSKVHEERLLGLLLLIQKYQAHPGQRLFLYDIYLRHTRYINNWDLVDVTAAHIVGDFLSDKDKSPLYRLARSTSLWERRIAIVATHYFIRKRQFAETLKISEMLLDDEHDLIHKAVGWMLREVGKRDQAVLERFLKKYYTTMPRTMLRYAIERFPERKRKAYLKGKI